MPSQGLLCGPCPALKTGVGINRCSQSSSLVLVRVQLLVMFSHLSQIPPSHSRHWDLGVLGLQGPHRSHMVPLRTKLFPFAWENHASRRRHLLFAGVSGESN